jgi:hypothetical protein
MPACSNRSAKDRIKYSYCGRSSSKKACWRIFGFHKLQQRGNIGSPAVPRNRPVVYDRLAGGCWRDRLSDLYLKRITPLPSAPVKKPLLVFLLLIFVPIAASAVRYFWIGDGRGNWQTADRSSAGLLPPATSHPDALIRVFAARTVRWRSIFAVHTWIVVKEKGATSYRRYDYTAWGEPIRTNGFAPDGRWFGAMPEIVVAVDGKPAETLIPKFAMSLRIISFVHTATIAHGQVPTLIRSCKLRWIRFLSSGRCYRRPRSARTFHTPADGSV